MTNNHKIIKTTLNNWKNYGQIVEENRYCQSLPRSVCRLRKRLDTSNQDTQKGLIGVLKFEKKTYNWFEKLDGQVKYFRLEEVEQPIISNVVSGQTCLFDKRSLEVG